MYKRDFMQHITGKDRHQIIFSSLEDAITGDNPVRVIDAFAEQLELNKLGFVYKSLKSEGRPSYEGKLFLKLYLYGYFNGIRSSRRLERECERNVEVRWLLGEIVPNYHSISDFRKENPRALKNTFRLFVMFLKEAGLISGKTAAADGSKFRASNSKKNNYNEKKIKRHLKYIEEKTNEYLKQLDENDRAEENAEKITLVKEKLERLKKNKIRYELLQDELTKSGDTQISTTDKDARALLVQGQVVEVSYNLEAAVDEKHNLVTATHVINRNDRNALHDIAREAKENVEAEELTVLADKGFHNGREIEECEKDSIHTIVAPNEVVNSNAHGTTEEYLVTKFQYNKESDTYTCPQGHTLTTTGNWHKKIRERDIILFRKYRTPQCKSCPVKHLCTGRQKGGREIERSQYADAVENNRKRYEENKELYKQRQMMNEHIFGTLKRKWGYNYTDLRGLEKVNGEFALIMTVYNLKRTINILGIGNLLEKLKTWKPDYKGFRLFVQKQVQKKQLYALQIFELKTAALKKRIAQWLNKGLPENLSVRFGVVKQKLSFFTA